MQEEEEGVPGEIPCRKRKRVFLVKYHAGRGRGWNTMHEGRKVKCPG
jgi:hypothetical protein